MNSSLRLDPGDVREVPEIWSGDVLVIGGGSAGCAAAVASARLGARVMLVESGAFLGGTGTRVLDTFYGFFAPGGEGIRVVGGIGWEVCQRLFAEDQAFERPNTYGAGTGVTYEPEMLKVVWDRMVVTAGAQLLLYALCTRVITEADQIRGVIVETRAGPARLLATTTIDATGDAEVAWRAGCALDRPTGDRLTQPATATFRMGGVAPTTASTAELHERMRAAVAAATHDLPRVEGSIHETNLPGVRHANMTRVSGVDVTDPAALTAAEVEGRQQVQAYARFLIDDVPGYGDAYLLHSSSRLGVRESRRLLGEYVLTEDDVLDARQFNDAIAKCGAPIEDHAAGSATRWAYVGRTGDATGQTYGIPYRCLVPRHLDGLLVAGRCLSATHDAHASVRSIGQCMAMGQAAGTAAVLAAHTSTAVRAVDVAALRNALTKSEVML